MKRLLLIVVVWLSGPSLPIFAADCPAAQDADWVAGSRVSSASTPTSWRQSSEPATPPWASKAVNHCWPCTVTRVRAPTC